MTQHVGIIWNYTIYIHLLSTGIIVDVFFCLEHVALATHIHVGVFAHDQIPCYQELCQLPTELLQRLESILLAGRQRHKIPGNCLGI